MVTPTFQWRATFEADLGSARRARASLGNALAVTGLAAAVTGDAYLLAGEIIGNAVRHAGTDFTVTATLTDEVLRIEVFDLDPRPPSLLGLDDESTGGRGLHLVSAIATEWGWRAAQDESGVLGKVVWAELRADGR